MNWFSWRPRALHSNQNRMPVKIVYSQSYARIQSFWPIRNENVSCRWPASCSSSSHVGLSFRRSLSTYTAGLLKFWLFVFTRLLFDPQTDQTGIYVFTHGCPLFLSLSKKLDQLYKRFSFHFIAFLFIYGFSEVIIYIYINNYSFIKNE